MAKKRYRDKEKEKNIALERIEELFCLAKKTFKHDPTLSDRYVELARKISSKIKVSIPSVFKRQFCKNCGVFWVPGVNVRTRTTGKTITYTCLNCKKQSRIAYKTPKTSESNSKDKAP